jgi:hypothetical protein
MGKFLDSFSKCLEKTENQYISLISEMSLRLHTDQDILNDKKQNQLQFDYITSNGDLIEEMVSDGTTFNVYNYPGHAQRSLGFTYSFLVAAIIEFDNISHNIIQISYTNAHQSFRGLMSKIMIDYLLNHYDEIISDNVQTERAYRFYKLLAHKLYSFKNDYNIYIFNDVTKEELLVTDPDQMDITYGDDVGHFNYRYIIKKK